LPGVFLADNSGSEPHGAIFFRIPPKAWQPALDGAFGSHQGKGEWFIEVADSYVSIQSNIKEAFMVFQETRESIPGLRECIHGFPSVSH